MPDPDPPSAFTQPADPKRAELAQADRELTPGVVVGAVIADKYRVLRVIGRGGMGIVVAASQLSLERTVAIKLIRGERVEQSLAVERLLREAKAAASIQSEHVARVLDVGMLDSGVPFIVMEYLEGHDLDTLLRRDGPLPPSLAIDYLLQACEAIAEAHRNGIVHRDLKPANVFIALGPGGSASVKVVDFGISKIVGGLSHESLTQPSRVVGSLFHMSPEQMRGKAVDARTDVWALGLLLFEMLTGKRPYRDAPWPDVCARVLSDAAGPFVVPGDEVPRELSAVIQRCLERQPAGRYQNVAELAVALAPFGGHSSRISLERVVRVATSTGSLAARTWTPAPPAELARAGDASRITPIVPPSEHDGLSTKEPVVTSAAAPSPRQKVWIGVSLGIALAASVGSGLMLSGARPTASQPSLAVQPLAAPPRSEPAAHAVEEASAAAPGPPSLPPAGSSQAPGAPRVSVTPVPRETTAARSAPSPPSRRVDDGARAPARTNAPAPTSTRTGGARPAAAAAASARTAASESSHDDGAPAAPNGPSPNPDPSPTSNPPPSPPPSQGAPAGAPSGATPTPGATQRPKVPDAWDLSDIDFKSTPAPPR
jgi:tRNA A-37 threonylcarbamoyl transferase component Bud32